MTSRPDTLWSRFQALTASEDKDHLSACVMATGSPHYLAKGVSGEPVLLLGAARRLSKRVPLRLRNVSVDFELECALHDGDGELTRGHFLRVACDPQSDDLHAFFVDAMSGLASRYASALSSREADEFVDKAIDLFSKLTQPAKKSVVGIWGELFVMYAAPDTVSMVRAWHGISTESFDFSDAGFLEVKTTESPDRIHEVSLEQVRPASGRSGTIASVLLQRSSSGASVLDLANDVASKLSAAESDKVWRVLAETLGHDLALASELKFDVAYARASVRFVPARDVPAPELPAHGGSLISSVRFRAAFAPLVTHEVGWRGAVAALFGAA